MKREIVEINGVTYTDFVGSDGKTTAEIIIDAMDAAITDELETQLSDHFSENKIHGIDMCKHLLNEDHWMWTRMKEAVEDVLYTYIKYEEKEMSETI